VNKFPKPKETRQHRYVRGNAHNWQVQAAANGFREVACMQGRPQVRAVSGVANDPLLLGEPDQQREEADIGRALD
jgi:hypothetical protein